jgi:hypothetical protein
VQYARCVGERAYAGGLPRRRQPEGEQDQVHRGVAGRIGVGDFRPRATDRQVMATTNRVSRPAAAGHSSAVAFGRKPKARRCR